MSSDTENEHDHEETNSFSLNRDSRSGRPRASGTPSPPLTWQEQAYERLKVLYGIGKLLSRFEGVEVTIPKLLTLCSSTLPFVSAVIIEKRGKKPTSTIWHAGNVSKEQLDRAVANAKSSFAYLTGASATVKSDLQRDATPSRLLDGVQAQGDRQRLFRENYIVLPFLVDNLPAFGVIQLEGIISANEKDLEFVDSLADLLAVAIDRHYKTQLERELQEREATEGAARLSRSQALVADLETERALRETFVSLLSHDLRTPLSAARISAQLIQRQPDISENARTLAARIVANVGRADQMISDLLDANRIRSGEKLPLHTEHFDLSALLKESIAELATIYGDRFVMNSAASVEGYWDRKGIRRIIENLCNNAVKYGSADGPITVSLWQMNQNACIRVQNTGEMISAEEQKSLFQQFRRGQSAQGSKKKGWGIGLTLVRGVAEAHGGSATVKSEADMGTAFTITLPIDSRPFVPTEAR